MSRVGVDKAVGSGDMEVMEVFPLDSLRSSYRPRTDENGIARIKNVVVSTFKIYLDQVTISEVVRTQPTNQMPCPKIAVQEEPIIDDECSETIISVAYSGTLGRMEDLSPNRGIKSPNFENENNSPANFDATDEGTTMELLCLSPLSPLSPNSETNYDGASTSQNLPIRRSKRLSLKKSQNTPKK